VQQGAERGRDTYAHTATHNERVIVTEGSEVDEIQDTRGGVQQGTERGNASERHTHRHTAREKERGL